MATDGRNALLGFFKGLFGILSVIALPAAMIWFVWTLDWRPAATVFALAFATFAYALCIEKSVADDD